MKKTVSAAEQLTQIIDAACVKNPHNKDIINAFQPILLEQRRLVHTLPVDNIKRASLDEQSFKAGIPLLQQNNLTKDSPWDTLALNLIPKIIEGLPALKDDLEHFAKYIHKHPQALSDIMQANAAEHTARIEQCSRAAGVSQEAVVFLTRNVARIILEQHAHVWADLLTGFAWDKGYCPICGGSPMIAHINEGIPQRWLHCSRCDHAWQFSRVICPACSNDDQKSMTYFFVEDAAHESTFVCEKCKHYLITVNKVSELAEFDAEVASLSLVHLDVLMQEKGYHPMAASGWNDIS